MSYEPDLPHAEARSIIDRGLDKARELKQAGAFVVVDAGGNAVSISRIGEGPPSSIRISQAKAYLAAMQRGPSSRYASNLRPTPALFAAFQDLLPDGIFPGPGGMPIWKDGRVVGAFATGGGAGIGPWTEVPGIDPSALTVGGAPANVEDLIIAHALEIPYEDQHPDVERIVGPRVDERNDGLPHSLATARRYADRAIELAGERGFRIGVAVVDETGQLMQLDRMDGGSPMGTDVAQAKALTALNFQRPSLDVGKGFPVDRLPEIREVARFRMLLVGGGVPITRDGIVVGAIGISSGGGPEREDELAREAISD